MKWFSAGWYYIISIPEIIGNFNIIQIIKAAVNRDTEVRVRGGLNYLVNRLMDLWTIKETVIDQVYNQYQAINHGDVVVDVGAAVGDFTILAAKKASRVTAWEYDSDRLKKLKKNIRLNGVNNVEIMPKKAVSLKQITRDLNRADFIKIDCEGGEYKIFQDADARTWNKINYLAMEAHRFNPRMEKAYHHLKNMLVNKGFILREISNPVHNNINYLYASRNPQLKNSQAQEAKSGT